MEKTRMEAFSDGVIAIIITIMVLEMKAPAGTSWAIIKPMAPKFFSYILSFLFVAIYWMNHHHLLQTVKQAKSSIMWANINLLFWLSLIPFATAWMGENHFQKITVCCYAALALMCGISFTILQYTVASHYDEAMKSKEVVKPGSWKSIASLIFYLLAVPIALWVNPIISGFLFLSVSIMWMIPDRNIEKALND
jgi:uncharacterized membrane protein